MGLTTIPRTVAKLEYSAIRLPFTLVDRHVVARYWDDEASVRLGFERFLGALDRFTGRLLGDDIGQRGGAPGRRTGSLAAASRLDTKAQAAWAKATTMMPGGLSQVLQAVRAENSVHRSDQQGCSPSRPAVMITDHVPTVCLPPDHAGGFMAAADPA